MLPQLARLYRILPPDLDDMTSGEIQTFLDDMHRQAQAQREQQTRDAVGW